MPLLVVRLGIGGYEELTDSILKCLIEGRTNVLTDVIKHLDVTLATASNVVLELELIVVVKDVGGVEGLVVKECGALCKLVGAVCDSADTTDVVDLSKVILYTSESFLK